MLIKNKEVKPELSSLTHLLLTHLHGYCLRLWYPTAANISLSDCMFHKKAKCPDAPHFLKHYKMSLDKYSGFLSAIVF